MNDNIASHIEAAISAHIATLPAADRFNLVPVGTDFPRNSAVALFVSLSDIGVDEVMLSQRVSRTRSRLTMTMHVPQAKGLGVGQRALETVCRLFAFKKYYVGAEVVHFRGARITPGSPDGGYYTILAVLDLTVDAFILT